MKNICKNKGSGRSQSNIILRQITTNWQNLEKKIISFLLIKPVIIQYGSEAETTNNRNS